MEKIKEILDNFVANGGDVNNLTSNHPVYLKIKKHKVYENGVPLSVGQKFQRAGHPRMTHGYMSIEYQLYQKVTEYLSKGGSLHIPRHDLPFYSQIKGMLKKHKRQTGKDATPKQMLESVGIFGYSDIYYAYLPILDMSAFKDLKTKCVDSYRKHPDIKGIICYQASLLDIPESLFVQLVLNENLEKSVLQTDRIAYCRKLMKDYVNTCGSFIGIRRDNPELYELMRSVKDNVRTSNGVPISMTDFVNIMGFEDVKHSFLKKFTGTIHDIEKIISNIKAECNTLKKTDLKASDLSRKDYDVLCEYAIRTNTSLSKIFEKHGLKYIDQGNKEIFDFVYISKYPFLNEMRQERDEMMNEFKKQNPSMVKEDLFENYLLICKSVYESHKQKIHTFQNDISFDSSKIKTGEFVFKMPEM